MQTMGLVKKRQPVNLGDKFGLLSVDSYSHSDKRGRKYYSCRCECGTVKTIHGASLVSGNTKSCGCSKAAFARTRIIGFGIASRNQVIAGYRHKANKYGRVFKLSVPQFETVAKSSCFYCGSEPSNVHRSPHGSGDYVYNSVDRIDSSKGYEIGNVVSACRTCNMAKSNRTQGEFIDWIRRSFNHLSKKVMKDQW